MKAKGNFYKETSKKKKSCQSSACRITSQKNVVVDSALWRGEERGRRDKKWKKKKKKFLSFASPPFPGRKSNLRHCFQYFYAGTVFMFSIFLCFYTVFMFSIQIFPHVLNGNLGLGPEQNKEKREAGAKIKLFQLTNAFLVNESSSYSWCLCVIYSLHFSNCHIFSRFESEPLDADTAGKFQVNPCLTFWLIPGCALAWYVFFCV